MSLTKLTSSYLNKKYKYLDIQIPIDNATFLPVKLTGVSVAFANALRRIFVAEVPTLALTETEVVEGEPQGMTLITNTSQYNRQVLLDRFGFIVLETPSFLKVNVPDLVFALCDPQDTNKSLKNTTDSIMMVTTHQHLQIHNMVTNTLVPTATHVPLDQVIMTLNPGEEVHAFMRPSWGTQRQHPRWQSSITCLKYETANDATEEIDTNETQMAYLRDGHDQPTGIILTIESVHRLPSKQVLLQGLDVLKQKLETFKTHLQLWDVPDTGKGKMVMVDRDDNIPNLVKLTIINEDHTLGNVLANFCLEKLLSLIKVTAQTQPRSEEVTQELLLESLSAYRKPHPLDNKIELRVRTPQTQELVFPQGQYDEITNPAIRLIILAVEEAQNLCDRLSQSAIDL